MTNFWWFLYVCVSLFSFEIKQLTFKLKKTVNTIILDVVIYNLNVRIKSHSIAVKKRHSQKISKLRRKNDCSSTNDVSKFVKSTVHNFSSYSVTGEEQVALSFELEQHILISTNKNLIYTKFEHFYQYLLINIKDLPEASLCRIKTKMGNTCRKY